MKRLSLSAKLYSIIGVLVVSSIAISWIGLSKMSEIKDSLNEIVNGTARRVGNARELKGLYLFQVIDEKNLIIETDYMKIESWGDVLNKRHQEIFQVIENAKKIANEEGSKDLEKFSELYSEWWEHSGEVVTLAKGPEISGSFYEKFPSP